MTGVLSVEVGENKKPSRCNCCGEESSTAHGFVYKSHKPHAVYYAGWANVHRDRGVTFALAIGEWDDESGPDDRVCFGLEAHEGEDEIFFRIIDPEESPWGCTDLLGKMLSRQDALKHPLLKESYEVTEAVTRHHPAIRDFLGAST